MDKFAQSLNKARGFILVSVMSLLLIVSLLALGAIETSILATRQSNIQWQFWQVYMQTIHINQLLQQQVLQGDKLACVLSFSAKDSYWQLTEENIPIQTCTKASPQAKSSSFVEILPPSVCVQSTQEQGILYRITTFTSAANGATTRAQSVIMAAKIPKATCQPDAIPLSLGLQSWRME